MRTHYENLKVAQNAPEEVVRAAYRAMSLLYHPDRNGGSADAHKIMQIINDAYAVLSDPLERALYDQKLARSRTATAQDWHDQTTHAVRRPAVPKRSWWHTLGSIVFWDLRLTLFAIIMAGAGINALFETKRPRVPYLPSPPTSSLGSSDRYSSPTYRPAMPAKPAYVRPATAPNGYPWPKHASYLTGTQQLHTGGLSSVTIDNTRNSSDVFLKLVSLSATNGYPVSLCFIPAFSQFTFRGVVHGRYDVRYKDLSTGGLSKTEEFLLQETKTFSGTEYSDLTLTLYKVTNGNMHTETIDESEF